MIKRGDLARPKRSITFMFDPEGHGSNVYFHSIRDRLDRVIAGIGSHCGGDPAKLEAGLRLTRTSGAAALVPQRCLSRYARAGQRPVCRAGATAQAPLSFVVLPPGLGQVASGWGVPAVEMGPLSTASGILRMTRR